MVITRLEIKKTNPKTHFVIYCFNVVQFSNLILLRTTCLFTCLKSGINCSFPLPLIETVKRLTTCGLFDSSFTKPPFNNSTMAISTKCLCSMKDLLFFKSIFSGLFNRPVTLISDIPDSYSQKSI